MKDSVLAGCKIKKPYPPVAVEKENPAYAGLLSVPYAGQGGEVSAVLSYCFGSVVTKDRSPKDLSAVLSCISETEMLHARMLAELIWKLGKEPVFAVDARHPFSAAGMNYETDPQKILFSAARAEQSAIAVYEKIITMIDDRYITALLERITEDERLHFMIFSEWLKE